jgi:hypothetical protein
MSGIFDQIINYAPPSLLLGTVTYKGTWSAATNTPTLVDPTSAITNGNYYVVDAAGTQFTLVFNIGDWIISNGSTWEKVDNTDAISSVFGRTGAVVGVSTDYSSVGITNTALGASNPSTVAATTVTATSTIAATGAVTGSNLSGTNTGDQTISLTGGVTGSGTGSFAATVVTNADLTGDVTSVGNATTLTNAPVIAKVLTGYSSGAGTVAATDSILQAIQKLDGNDSTNADLTGVITSSGNATSIASQTGTGTKFVVDTSPTLVTPNIGVATGTSLAAALNGSLGATTPSTVAATTISGTTLTSTVSGTEVDFVLGNNTAGRRMELGTNSGGHGYLKLRNASNTETITANAGSGLSITGTLAASTNVNAGGNNLSLTNTNAGSSAQATIRFINDTAEQGNISLNSSTYSFGTLVANAIGIRSYTAAGVYLTAENASGHIRLGIGATPSTVADFSSTGLNSTAIGATTPSTGAFTTGGYNNAVGDSQFSVGTVAPSIKLVDNYTSPNSSTKAAILAMATTAGNYGLADGDVMLGMFGASRGNLYLKPNYSGAGTKQTYIVSALDISGNTAITGTLSATSDLRVTDTGGSHFILIGNQNGGGTNTPVILRGVNATLQIGTGTSWSASGGGTLTTIADFSSTGVAVTGALSATTTAGQHTINVTQSISTGYSGINILRAGTGQQAIRFTQATDGNEVGSVTLSTTATTYGTSSDYRLKDITGAVTDSGTFIDSLKPKVGTWKSDGSKFVGFIAHEFAKVSPSSVQGEKDAVDAEGNPKYQSMQASTSEVVANLVAELQSLRKRLAALESK